jgi:hypothetical protein
LAAKEQAAMKSELFAPHPQDGAALSLGYRVREGMKAGDPGGDLAPLAGEREVIEADEAYIGRKAEFAKWRGGAHKNVVLCGQNRLRHYLAEFDFRHSNRIKLSVDDVMCAERALKGAVGRRLTYQQLVATKRPKPPGSEVLESTEQRQGSTTSGPPPGGVNVDVGG